MFDTFLKLFPLRVRSSSHAPTDFHTILRLSADLLCNTESANPWINSRHSDKNISSDFSRTLVYFPFNKATTIWVIVSNDASNRWISPERRLNNLYFRGESGWTISHNHAYRTNCSWCSVVIAVVHFSSHKWTGVMRSALAENRKGRCPGSKTVSYTHLTLPTNREV